MKLIKIIALTLISFLVISFLACEEKDKIEIKTSIIRIINILSRRIASIFGITNNVVYVDKERLVYYPVYIYRIVHVCGEEELEEDFFEEYGKSL
jgi:uncharacterized protein with PQ loop repeat